MCDSSATSAGLGSPGWNSWRCRTSTVEGSSAKWGYDVVFNGNPARVDYVAELAADGTLKGNVLRNGSPSPITAVKQ